MQRDVGTTSGKQTMGQRCGAGYDQGATAWEDV